MGIAASFARAFGRAIRATNVTLPTGGQAFISVKDDDKPAACAIARRLRALGFTIVATDGTAAALARARIPSSRLKKAREGSPHCVDAIREGAIALVVNTTVGAREIRDSYSIRRASLLSNIPYFTTMAAALAAVDVLEADVAPGAPRVVRSLQEWHEAGR